MGAALDDLYSAFAAYPRPATFLGCGCGECDFQNAVVVAPEGWNGTKRPIVEVRAPGDDRSLRDLDPDELQGIAYNVPVMGGDVGVLKHYLPRLLELSSENGDEGGWPAPVEVFGRLVDQGTPDSTPWWTWSDAERDAIEPFLHEAWRRGCTRDSWHASSMLDVLVHCARDVAPYLKEWDDAGVSPDEQRDAFYIIRTPGDLDDDGTFRSANQRAVAAKLGVGEADDS